VIGKTVSHYKILEELGEGGMGVVYKAEDTKLGRTVALKFLPPELTRDVEARRRFEQEARAASALDHPNICTIFEIDETDDGRLFITMAYCSGGTVKAKIEHGQMQLEEALDIAIGAARGLSRAHQKGIVHRDIKPANLLLTEDGETKVVDFGIAKLAGQTKLTKTGTTLGTTSYMSPEQVQGKEVDHRTDIWSLGIVLYEMTTGRQPFRGDYDQAVMYSIIHDEPEPVANFEPGVLKELNRVIKKAMTKDANRRYQHADEILGDLQSLREKIMKKAISEQRGGEEKHPSIAVLPFVNMSPDPGNEYFGDGLAEELINALTRLEGLRVAARTSSFRFRGKDLDIREIGKQLNVNTILEGSVRKAGNRLRVTAQLINVADGYHLWSDRYDREMKDIFAIQDEITANIVDQLRIKLITKAGEPLIKRYTDNLEAYSLYLKGLYYWNSLTPEGWQKSRECYEKAIEIDPDYALAYVGLSVWHQSLAFWGNVRPVEAMEKSREAARRALEHDDTIGLAHCLIAVINWAYDWDCIEAEKAFKRSLELVPAMAILHVNYAIFLSTRRRFEEALIEAKTAQQLDPLSSIINTWASAITIYMGRPDDAINQLKQIVSTDPEYWQIHYFLGQACLFRSKFDEAVISCERAVELSGEATIAVSALACAYYLAGREDKGENLLVRLQEQSRLEYVQPHFFVDIHLARRDMDEALHWIEKAIEEHDPWLCFLTVYPEWMIPPDPRFNALLKKTGIGL